MGQPAGTAAAETARPTGSDAADALRQLVNPAAGAAPDIIKGGFPHMENGGDGDEKDKDKDKDKKPDEGGEGERKEMRYDPKSMSKHMNRWMKENADEARKCMKDAGLLAKAVADAVPAAAEVAASDAIAIDGTGLFKAVEDFVAFIPEIFQKMDKRLDFIERSMAYQNDIVKAQSSVLLAVTDQQTEAASQPAPRRSVSGADLTKAGEDGAGADSEHATVGEIKGALLAKAQAGDQTAGRVLAFYENANGNLGKLDQSMRDFVARTMKTFKRSVEV